jgi:aminoglycoside phosphotransferase (APT) family kinase protein
VSDRAAAIAAWYRARRTDADAVTVRLGRPLSQGYSNEVVVAEVDLVRAGHGGPSTETVVVRLPPLGPPLFPEPSLRAEVAVQQLAAEAGVPVPHPLVVEDDPSWLGTPFLVMPLMHGRHPGEVPALTDWLLALSPDGQRRVQAGMLDALVALHRAPWEETAVAHEVRRPATAADEVRWWEDFVAWACEGRSPGPLADALARCRDTAPDDLPAPSALWGDVRLGNTVVGDDLAPVALLDWEMTTVGPAESDVAWYTALSAMTDHFVGSSLPGFLDRDGVVAHVEAGLGRPLRDLGWHESFALVRAAAAHLRTRIVAALAEGAPFPDPATDGVVQYACGRVG